MTDARSINPMNLSAFDTNKDLLNCMNGTYSLSKMELMPHRPAEMNASRSMYLMYLTYRKPYVARVKGEID